jgi:hypothetical protein
MTNSTRRDAIRANCAARRIDTLVHFTRMENLSGILSEGIVPRSVLERQTRKFILNDDIRADGCKDAVCLSISFPNYKMFWKLRQMDESAIWVVLLVRADVLWELDCAFCWANAARSVISRLPLAVRKHPASLECMFPDRCEISGISRAACGIPDCYPTNPQAEVLAFSTIPPQHVTAAYFNDQGGRAKFRSLEAAHLQVGVHAEYFRYRRDWELWKQDTEASAGDSWQDAPSSVPF